MTTVDVMTTVLQCRCMVDEVVYAIEVSVHESTHESATYHAVAFVDADEAAVRRPVVNDRGMRLVAVGRSPSAAASFMSAVLRRRHGRGDVRSLVTTRPHSVRGAAEAGFE